MNSRLDWLVLSDYYSIYVTNAPPLVNNTNPDDKLEFVLFFSNEYFGIEVDLNGKSDKTDCKSVGIPFVITNYRKGVFFAIFRDRSGAVRPVKYSNPRVRKKSSKNTLFSVRSIFAVEKPTAMRLV